MKINTTLGLLAGKLSGSILEKMGRGSTLPGKVALKFDKDILSQLAKNYEIVVITGTNGKTLTTALTVGILQEAFGIDGTGAIGNCFLIHEQLISSKRSVYLCLQRAE